MYTFAYMDCADGELMVVQSPTDADALELSYEFSHRYEAVSGVYFGEMDGRDIAEHILKDGFWFVRGDEKRNAKPRRFMSTIREIYGF